MITRRVHGREMALLSRTKDSKSAELYQMRMRVCVPNGLEHTKSTYPTEAGWARTVRAQVSADTIAQMHPIRLDSETLGDIFESWIDAGISLGHTVNERARMEAELAKSGLVAPTLNANSVRSLWIRSMRAVLASIDVIEMSETDRSALLSPLQKLVADAERRRPQGLDGADGDADADADGDADADADADADSDADADAE